MRISALVLMVFCLISCSGPSVPLPKPRIYPRIIFPEKEYQSFENTNCPFTMDIPLYFDFLKDTKRIETEMQFECWFDLYCESLNTFIHLSYFPVANRSKLDEYIQDAFELADKHNVKADYRDELKIENNEKKIYGFIFDIGGPVASPCQFFLTDSTHHFLRGSLYFNAEVNRDSIAPVYEYLKTDIHHMIESLVWN